MIFWLITTNLVSALPDDICKNSSNPVACKKTIERLKKEKEIDPNNTIRKIINFGLQRSLILKANMTEWALHGNLWANELAAIKGCLDAIDVTVDDLRKTLKEVDDLESAQRAQDFREFMFHSGNIKTWLQNAINALQSCQDDDFAMPRLEGVVKQVALKRVADLMIATKLAIWTVEYPISGSNRPGGWKNCCQICKLNGYTEQADLKKSIENLEVVVVVCGHGGRREERPEKEERQYCYLDMVGGSSCGGGGLGSCSLQWQCRCWHGVWRWRSEWYVVVEVVGCGSEREKRTKREMVTRERGEREQGREKKRQDIERGQWCCSGDVKVVVAADGK
ncbi:hypothetical protein R6Q57_002902 [Mikania cordata]